MGTYSEVFQDGTFLMDFRRPGNINIFGEVDMTDDVLDKLIAYSREKGLKFPHLHDTHIGVTKNQLLRALLRSQ